MNKNTDKINGDDAKLLLSLARKTIIQAGKKNIIDEKDLKSDVLKEKRGCFVTLNKNGDLRGCIGYILPLYPLYQAVIDNAYNAAYTDPRFNPVTKEEISGLHIDISVLTVPEKLQYKNKDDLLSKLTPLKDGVIIKSGYRSSTFLPQVWEQLPDKKNFLSHLCMKAGLNPLEWEKGNLEVEIYSAQVIEE